MVEQITVTVTMIAGGREVGDLKMEVYSYTYDEQFLVLTEYQTAQKEKRVHLIPMSQVGYVLVSIKSEEQPA